MRRRNTYSLLSVLFLGILLFLQGCATTEVMDVWKGRHRADLVAEWGPPTYTEPDKDGGEKIVYEKITTVGEHPIKDYSDQYGNVIYKERQKIQYKESRIFYVDADGYISDCKTEGEYIDSREY